MNPRPCFYSDIITDHTVRQIKYKDEKELANSIQFLHTNFNDLRVYFDNAALRYFPTTIDLLEVP